MGFLMISEYFDNILGIYRRHTSLKILNQMELWFCVYFFIQSGWGIYTSVLPEIVN